MNKSTSRDIVKNYKKENIMKKLLGVLLILAVVLPCCVAVFTGCEGAIDYEHTIVFYSSQGDALQQVTQNAINNFETKYPGWKVEHVQAGGYDDVKEKIVSDFQGKQQPDVAYCYADHVAQYLQTGKVYNLNDLINSKETVTDGDGNEVAVGYTAEEIADFVEGYYNEGYAWNYSNYEQYGYSENDMLTIPFVKSTELMYYNKTVLDELNLEPAKTWTELWNQCRTIKAQYSSVTPLAYDSEANWFITMCEQNGWGYTDVDPDKHYLFDNENTRAWLNQLREYYNKGYIVTQELYGAYTSGLFTKGTDGGCIYCIGSSGGASYQNPGKAFEYGIARIPGTVGEDGEINYSAISQGPSLVMFEAGNADGGCIYCIGSSGGASYQNPGKAFEYGIARIPGTVGEDGEINYSAISQGPSLVMFEAGNAVTNIEEKKIMTWLFVKELLDPTFQAAFGKSSGYNPCRNSAYENKTYADHMAGNDITAVAAKVAASMIEDFFTSPAFVGSSQARTQVGNVINYCLTGSKTPEKALADAVKNCGGNKK